MSRHTPGTWVYIEDSGEIRSANDYALIAVTPEFDDRPTDFRLIAAAPELLEAVAYSLDLISQAEAKEISAPEFAVRQALAHKKLKAARAKAEGRE